MLVLTKKIPLLGPLVTKKSLYINHIDSVTSVTIRKRKVLIVRSQNDKIRVKYKGQKTFYPDLMILLNSNVQVTEEFKYLASKVN